MSDDGDCLLYPEHVVYVLVLGWDEYRQPCGSILLGGPKLCESVDDSVWDSGQHHIQGHHL